MLEPFAGTGQIADLIEAANLSARWQMFDIDPNVALDQGQDRSVELRDSIANFPKGFQAAITNPPYLSYHFAKRKGLQPVRAEFFGFDSLYQAAIAIALENCDFVAMIIPESFITSGLFTERLDAVISLPFQMFDDTDMPTCLALWSKKPTSDFDLWRGNDFVGLATQLFTPLVSTQCKKRVSFNIPNGNLGLRAIDNSTEASIRFCEPELIPIELVKPSARLLTRVQISGLENPTGLINLVNKKIDEWRAANQDVALTAFKGIRKDGRFRRRLDYANARALLSQALCELDGHSH